MGLIDRIIGDLSGEYVPHYPDLITQIKNNIKSLLNTNPNDCIGIANTKFIDFSSSSIEKGEFVQEMGKALLEVIQEYEKKISILSLHYDDTNMPWKLSFSLRCCLSKERFKEFNLLVDFYNNRYCEVS